MRRLLIINNIPSHYRTFMFGKLAERGRAHGVKVTVAFQARGQRDRPWDPSLYEMAFDHYISTGLIPWGKQKEWYTPRTFNTDIVRDALRGGYDWVLFAPLMSPTTWVIALGPTGAQKLMWSESNLTSARHLRGIGAWFKRQLHRPFSALVCPGQRAVDYVLHFNPELADTPVVWVPNIVDTEIYRRRVEAHRGERNSIRRELGIGDGELLVLGVGQAIERKGYHLLVEAVSDVPGNYTVILLGDGESRQAWLRRLSELGIADRVRFPGEADPTEVARHLAAADFFIHTALRDPSPLVCVEAAVADMPMAVSTQTGNGPEAVHEGENGFTFDPTDRRQMVGALRRIVATSAEDRAAMARRSREIAATTFDPDVIADGFLRTILEGR